MVLASMLALPFAVRAQQVSNPHGQLAVPCAACHAPEAWKPARITSAFKHAPGSFPLDGAHARTTCMGCHKQLDFKGVTKSCASCHEDVHKGELGADCSRCHSTRSFAEEPAMKQAHELTRFPLRGAHAAVSCTSCHTRSASGQTQFVGRSTTCQSCHAADARAVSVPDHQAAGFVKECTACHSINSWKNGRFDHDQTAFPLVGAHRTATCEGCHADKVYPGRATTCVSCHRADYDRAVSPRHSDGFPTTCADCHTNTDWDGAHFDHATTRFALTGAHQAVACSGCHADLVYRGKSMECASCHQTDFHATTNPPHASAGFTAPCTSCHTTTAWAGAGYDHDATDFPLTGTHRTTTCARCHADKVFNGKATTCVSCHQPAYDAARTPPHTGFPTTCETCHATVAWIGATFDHASTAFPLTGTHRTTSCSGCHGDGVYNGKPTECASCHRATYDATTQPPHASAGYPTTCATCHNTTAWPGAFNHSATLFPLTGAHVAAPCQSCHADGVYKGKPTACLSCHQADYTATTKPPHGASAIGTACTSCHTTTAWAGGTYDHNVTSFPLTGAHRAASCAGCHADGVYKGKSTACLSCHQADYTATTKPPHGSSGIGTACTTCHTTSAWVPSTFNHSATAFPLTGAHIATSCLGCHGDGVYKGKSTACASCHQADYAATTNPNHTAASFPTTCASCHSTTTWLGATFDHDALYFPIYSGKHRGNWASCATCHTSPTNYQQFTCLTCHEHDRTSMDDKHKSMPTYRYDSQTCYACHPRGTKP